MPPAILKVVSEICRSDSTQAPQRAKKGIMAVAMAAPSTATRNFRFWSKWDVTAKKTGAFPMGQLRQSK